MDGNIHHIKHEFAAKYILLLFFFFSYQVHVFVTWFLVKWQESGVRSPVPGQNATWFLRLDYRQSQRFYVEGFRRECYALPLDNAQAVYCHKGSLAGLAIVHIWISSLGPLFLISFLHSLYLRPWPEVFQEPLLRASPWWDGGWKPLKTTFPSLTHCSVAAVLALLFFFSPTPRSIKLPQSSPLCWSMWPSTGVLFCGRKFNSGELELSWVLASCL